MTSDHGISGAVILAMPSTSSRRGRLIPAMFLLCIAAWIAGGRFAHGQKRAVGPPNFDVASVKPCRADIPPDRRSGGGISSPETLDIRCQTVRGLIHMAYVVFASGTRVTPLRTPVEGGPSWINSERYDIRAKADGVTNQVLMNGPMLQVLLTDRFQLKVHRETRNIPVYVLTVAKGGAKLQPFREGSCNPFDIAATFPPPPPPENPCRNTSSTNNGVVTVVAQANSLDDFAQFILGSMDRPVINRTGIKGRFDFRLEYTPDEFSSPAGIGRVVPAGELSGPSIFTAVRQLGLKLEATKGPGEYLIVDHVERPSEN